MLLSWRTQPVRRIFFPRPVIYFFSQPQISEISHRNFFILDNQYMYAGDKSYLSTGCPISPHLAQLEHLCGGCWVISEPH